MLYYVKKGKNTTEMQKKKEICAVYEEGAVTDGTCQNGLWSFMLLEISRWMMLHSQADQLNLIAIKLRH